MDALARLNDSDAAMRLWARDASLFSDDTAVQEKVTDRLGWLGLGSRAAAEAALLADAATAVRESGITDIVLLGMGGSSLAPLVISSIIGSAAGAPALHVLDTTSPWAYLRLRESLVPETTLVIVSSKSGGTIEPLSLYAVFRSWFDSLLHEGAGNRFIAVTDPDSSLERLADDQGFAAVFHAPPDVGGRYSALTPFGMVPASLIGVDVAALADTAMEMEAACEAGQPDSPAVALAAWIADAHAAGRDKLTLVSSPSLATFGLWVEQLVAESTGKSGIGVVPVLEDGTIDPASYGADRAICVVRTPDDEALAGLAARLPEGTPHFEIVFEDPYALGGEFVRWEIATALLGHLMGVNPFDEPNVSEAKEATSSILSGETSVPEPQLHIGETRITTDLPARPAAEIGSLTVALEALLDGAGPGDYLAVLAYLPQDRELTVPLAEALSAVSSARGLACCLEIGPRYLHSTGQLHKGGAPTGRFLMITARDNVGPSVPGRSFTLAQLHRAQAEGDYATLVAHGLPVVRVDMPEPAHGPVRLVAETLRGLG